MPSPVRVLSCSLQSHHTLLPLPSSQASALALKKVPAVNSSWHGDFIRQYNVVDCRYCKAWGGGSDERHCLGLLQQFAAGLDSTVPSVSLSS